MSFFGELKRRNVFRAAIAYLALAWLLIEVAGTLFPGFGIPDWAFRFVVIVLVLGFVPVLIFSWAYEITPEGLKREKDVARNASGEKLTARRLDWLTICLVVVALGFVTIDRLWLSSPSMTLQESSSDISTEAASPNAVATEFQADSIAVLPFANRSDDPKDRFFVDGIHDDLLSYISQIGSIKTISRTSVMKYRDSTLSIPEIAGELGVATVLEGGVQRAGDQVRINVQLIDARSDSHLWSQIYDRQLTAANVFAIQSEIAESIAGALRTELTPGARDRISNVPTENLEALENYFLGRQKMDTRVVADLSAAVQYFENAVELDPEFALAHVNLAYATALYARYSGLVGTQRQVWLDKSRAAADRALQIDPRMAEAHAAIGLIGWYRRDFDGAEKAFTQALRMNPNEPQANQWFGMLLSGRAGRVEEALQYSRKAVTLDPKSAIIICDYGDVLNNAGRFDEALAQYRKAVSIEPRFAKGHRRLGDQAVRMGRLDQAIIAYRQAQAIEPDNWQVSSQLGDFYLMLGDDEQAEFWFDLALRLSPGEEQRVSANLGRLYLERGDVRRARQHFESTLQADPRDLRALYHLANLNLAEGDVTGALSLYRNAYPGLFEDDPSVEAGNHVSAIHLAALYSEAEEPRRMEKLLDLAWQITQTFAPRHFEDEAAILALRHNHQAALDVLTRNDLWRDMLLWREVVIDHPAFKALWGHPELQALVESFEKERKRQQALVRESEANGEIDPLPEI